MGDPWIDVHIHLAGNGCCNSGCWMSPRFQRRYTYRAIRFLQGITDHQLATSIDQDWAQRISDYVGGSSLSYGVVLGFDGAYHETDGALDETHSQMIVPDAWVFEICRRFKNLLPGPSINPYKTRALEMLEAAIQKGAVLIKWLPSAQNIDPQKTRLEPFYERLAAAAVPLLVHTGGERTFESFSPEFNSVQNLKLPLSLGVKVIAAHAATPVRFDEVGDETGKLIELLGTYQNLWVDNSGICNPARFHHLGRLAQTKAIAERTLFGSDWPVPANAIYYLKDLGFRKTFSLERIRNPIERDLQIKRAMGFDDSSFTRAHAVLAHLDRWTSAP